MYYNETHTDSRKYSPADAPEEKHRAVEEELDRLCATIEMLNKNICSLSGRLEKISVTMPEILVEDSDVKKEKRSDSEITRRICCIVESVQYLSSRVRNMEDSLEV